MPEQTKSSQIDYFIREYPHRKETCLVKFVDGFETTHVCTRKLWAKGGRQGAWQHCARFKLGMLKTINS